MKKSLLLLIAILSCVAGILAQSAPQGMRYQAIARSMDGNLLASKLITVQVELISGGAREKVFYAESHDILSNELGLLDFVIGEGKSISGLYTTIPWSSEQLWIRISVKPAGEKNFQIISTGQLYSVPFAMFAEQAGALKEEAGNRTSGQGMNSINWTLEGNYNSQNRNGGHPVLGTTDANDLVIVTKNIPRIEIDKNGAITFFVNIDFNGNLNVDGNTTLNALDVDNMSSTHLTGQLTVDKVTTLNDHLAVMNMAQSHLTGSLDVDQSMTVNEATSLNSSLEVTGMNPVQLSGTLETDGATSLHDELTVLNSSSTLLSGSLDVDKTLEVDEATTLNSTLTVGGIAATTLTGTLQVDQVTILNDDLSVENASPVKLTGDLDADQAMNVDGATTLNNSLEVTGMSSSDLGGTLTVDQQVTLHDDLTVANMAPTHLTGSLTVDGAINAGGAITIEGALEVTGMNPAMLSGTLEADKLATMKGGLHVSGPGNVGPGNDHLVYFDNTESGNTDGIGVRINNGDANKENNYMTFYRGNGNTVAGRIEGYLLGDIDQIPAPTEDEIWTAVCVALADYNPITIAWTQMATGLNLVAAGWNNTTIPSFEIPDIPAFNIPDVPALTIPDIPAFVIPDIPSFTIPDIPGVTIPDVPSLTIGPYLCGTVCFCDCCDFCFDFNCCCVSECIIPSFTLFPGITIPDFPGIAIPDFPGIPIPDFNGIVLADFPGITIPDFPGLVIPAVPELDLSAVFGEIPTIPTFSDILVSQGVCPNEDIFNIENGYVRRLANWALDHRLQNLVTIDPVALVAGALTWGLQSAVLDHGVVYGSKGADYAEYLPKLYQTEQFLKGEVVGLYNGRISKNTKNADQILAITSQPLVLGNMPDQEFGHNMEKVAFLGQIPVYVKGPVAIGDYILPSGKNDGVAIALPAKEITASMLSQVLGTAWSAFDGEEVTLINTSIGLRPVEISNVLQQQAEIEASMETKIRMQREESDLMNRDLEQIRQKLGLSASSYNP